MSTAYRNNRSDAQGSKYVIGYLVAASITMLFWIGLYGWAFNASSSGVPDARHCAEMADQAMRLACYDSTSHAFQRQPGRGYAPSTR